MQAYAMQM